MTATLALNSREDITRTPKQRYQWPHKKDLYPPKKLKTAVNIMCPIASCHNVTVSSYSRMANIAVYLNGFSEFRQSDKSLKHKLGSINRTHFPHGYY